MNDSQPDKKYLRTDEWLELLEATRFAHSRLAEIENPHAWRWVIIGTVLALQGACVLALRGEDSTGSNLLEKGQREAYLEWLSSTPIKPTKKWKNASVASLFRRVCGEDAEIPAPYSAKLTSQEYKDVEKAIELRNEFIHFGEQGLSLELAGLSRICRASWKTVRHLCINFPTFSHGRNQDWLYEMKSIIDSIELKLTQHESSQ